MGKIDITGLSVEERLDLIGEIWDSLDDGTATLSDEMKTTLRQRRALFDADSTRAIPWPDLRAKLRPTRP